jgi:hypothetical protein
MNCDTARNSDLSLTWCFESKISCLQSEKLFNYVQMILIVLVSEAARLVDEHVYAVASVFYQ